MKRYFPAIPCFLMLAISAHAQLFDFTTLAGSASRGNVDGLTNAAQFNNPGGVMMDAAGNVYVADTSDDTIREIAPNGAVSTFAGLPGVSGSADGSGTNALFNAPQSVAVDVSGNVYVADTGNDTIRKITPTGTVSTMAGQAGNFGSADGVGTNAQFYGPAAVAVDASGNVFVADTWNNTIREISPAGAVTTMAGSPGNFGSTNATGTNALFYEPAGVAVGASDDVFVSDTGNNTIREIAAGGAVSTLAGSTGSFGSADGTGTNALFDSPCGVSLDASGNLYVADDLNNTIRQVTPAGVVTTITGSPGNFGSADGTGTNALFWGPQGVAVNPTNASLIYVADTGNSTIRQLVSSGQNWLVSTFAGDASIGSADATGNAARFFWPMDVAADGQGNFYVADAGNHTIRKINSNGAVTTFAGSPGISGSADGNGTNALLNAPQGVAADASGNVYVTDTGNSTIRKITPDGAVSTLAGLAENPGSSDGAGTNAQFYGPTGIAVDGSSNLFVADSLNQTIREITPAGVVTTFAGVAGDCGSVDGTNSAARFNRPTGLAIDSAGNLFVADLFNHAIREITPDGAVRTLAGLPEVFGNTDGTNCAARFFEPEGITVDSKDNVYIADAGNCSIRQLTPVGTNWVVSTIAGWPGTSGSADGSGVGARFCFPAGITMSNGTLFVADSGNNTIRSGTMITNQPPTILSQPQSQAVLAGSAVSFTVNATGTGPLYYQWQLDGANILGATAASYSLSNAQSADAGTYTVLVISPTGTTLSSNAVLAVYVPPAITNQPAGQTCLQGATVTLSVLAGPQPLTYQWEENGRPLANSASVSGATTSTLTLSNVTTANSGNYSVLVNNSYGFIISSSAVLTVFFVPPPDSIQPYAWWQLNEGVGSTAFDYSGNGHNGAVNSGVSWTANGYSGIGAYFDGTNSADISLNNSFTLSANWTATMWVNRWGAKDSSVILGGSSDALKLEQHSHTNHVGYTIYGKADYALGYVAPQNTWTHLVYVETSAGVSLYANGALVSSLVNTAALNAVTLGFGLSSATTDYLDATLDDVRIYNQALTAQQIANLYAYGRITPIPAITLSAPTNGASFIVSSNVTLTANVVSNGQNLVAIQFFAGTNLLGQTGAAPYTWTWTNVPPGNYFLIASAVYNATNTAASPPIGIYVGPSLTRPSLVFSATNGMFQLSWPLDHTGWQLQIQTNSNQVGLSTNWMTVSGSTMTNQVVLPPAAGDGNAFYRLVYP